MIESKELENVFENEIIINKNQPLKMSFLVLEDLKNRRNLEAAVYRS
jgi:hypothetical protein